jgi:hypothetical protein
MVGRPNDFPSVFNTTAKSHKRRIRVNSDMDVIFSDSPELGTIDDVILALDQCDFWSKEFLQRAVEHEKKRYARQELNKLGYVSIRVYGDDRKLTHVWKHESALTESELSQLMYSRRLMAKHFEATAAETEKRLQDLEPFSPDHPPKEPANQKRQMA